MCRSVWVAGLLIAARAVLAGEGEPARPVLRELTGQELRDAQQARDRADLLRVPGIGPRGADAILTARRKGCLSDLAHLSKLGIHAQWAAPYILLDGRRPPLQLPLFGDSQDH